MLISSFFSLCLHYQRPGGAEEKRRNEGKGWIISHQSGCDFDDLEAQPNSRIIFDLSPVSESGPAKAAGWIFSAC